MSQALKVAVIGVGHLGKWHADKYAASPDCKLLAIVDNNLEDAKHIAQKHGARAYSDYHNILFSGQCDQSRGPNQPAL